MFYEPHARDEALLPRSPINAIVAPRPIGWIATMSRAGEVNLAPYSFFNVFCSVPPIVGFSSVGRKDSLSFAEETGEFTFSLATGPLREQVNLTSASLPRGQSEFAFAGLEAAPSRLVRPMVVAQSPAAFECVVTEIVRLKTRAGAEAGAHLVLGEVVGVHIDDRFIRDGRFDTAQALPLGRCGYHDYCVIDDQFAMPPPAAG
jgi:flavin reductase (DIM6/NTAB) family NADH-FMN oxidoreductase RutF